MLTGTGVGSNFRFVSHLDAELQPADRTRVPGVTYMYIVRRIDAKRYNLKFKKYM